mmetsp:Transcript_32982/g.69394  ORF Transcript_32982/g.69394 Transcript_32982/m.69394 type:complete len:387 (+) Transcript_32982:847-2007(+)
MIQTAPGSFGSEVAYPLTAISSTRSPSRSGTEAIETPMRGGVPTKPPEPPAAMRVCRLTELAESRKQMKTSPVYATRSTTNSARVLTASSGLPSPSMSGSAAMAVPKKSAAASSALIVPESGVMAAAETVAPTLMSATIRTEPRVPASLGAPTASVSELSDATEVPNSALSATASSGEMTLTVPSMAPASSTLMMSTSPLLRPPPALRGEPMASVLCESRVSAVPKRARVLSVGTPSTPGRSVVVDVTDTENDGHAHSETSAMTAWSVEKPQRLRREARGRAEKRAKLRAKNGAKRRAETQNQLRVSDFLPRCVLRCCKPAKTEECEILEDTAKAVVQKSATAMRRYIARLTSPAAAATSRAVATILNATTFSAVLSIMLKAEMTI